jgi:uncharacterized oligopeptide transporter (OPT) family protein
MQDYKAGHLIGSTPRYLTYAQLLAAPIGAAAVAWMYPLLRTTYGVGGDGGLASPISQRVAGFAEFLTTGGSALLPGAGRMALIFAGLGIVLALLETNRTIKKWLPSATAVGMGMVVPGLYIFTMVLGGFLAWVWIKASGRDQAQRFSAPLASGLIAGEALVAVLIPLLVAVGLLSAQ